LAHFQKTIDFMEAGL